jgi:hypothetical protein
MTNENKLQGVRQAAANAGGKAMKWAKALALLTAIWGVTYVGWGLLANKQLPDRKFEQAVEPKIIDNKDHFFIGDIDLQQIIDENKLEMTPSLLYALYRNEVDNKTRDFIGSTVSDISEWVRKAIPWLRTPNKSFWTWQVQDGAFLRFLEGLSSTEHDEITRQLAELRVDGKTVMQRTWQESIPDFRNYINSRRSNTDDGEDSFGRWDGTLGFAMSLVMINKIYKDLDVSQENIRHLYPVNEHPAAKYLLRDNYIEGAVSALRATHVVRAKEHLPKQLSQNIDIINMWIKDNGIYTSIQKSLFNNDNTPNPSIYLDLPDGDAGRKFKNNSAAIEQSGMPREDVTYRINNIERFAASASLVQKKQLAILLANSSFENLYFWLDALQARFVSTKFSHVKSNFANDQLKDQDLDQLFSTFDEEKLDLFISFSLDALRICTHEHVNFTIPVIQAPASPINNTVNTVRRFDVGMHTSTDTTNPINNNTIMYPWSDTVNYPSLDTTAQILDTIQSSLPVVKIPAEETVSSVPAPVETVIEKPTKNTEVKVQYSVIRTLTIKKWFLPRNAIKNQSQVMSYLISKGYKDIHGKQITQETSANAIPEAVVAQFLSLDGKTPLTPGELNRLPKDKNIYIIIPK